MGVLIGWIFAIASTPITIFVRGLCISVTWGWFIAPVTGWRTISIAEAIGISIFVSVFNRSHPIDRSKFDDKTLSEITALLVGEIIGGGLIGPLVVLGIAWVWENFMMPISN